MTAQAATSVESFHTPGTVADAVAMKSGFGDTAIFLAGGTDLGVQMRRRIVEPAHLISLGEVDGFRSIDRVGDEIVIGAGVTHRQLEASPLLDGPLAALAEACRTVGSVQTRTVGTIGGNLCNASPAADTPPVLLALGASVSIAGPDGERTISLDDFFEGYRLTAIAADEILTAVRIPVPDGSRGSAFIKLGRRRAMEISIACVGARIDLAADGAIATAGIGLGSVAATTVRASAAEAVLAGAVPGPEAWGLAGAAALEACDPIDDVRATAAYRKAMVPVLVARALDAATVRAGGPR